MTAASPVSLVVRRIVAASPERLFSMWTTPELLVAWWGPRGVTCTQAEIDARVGGRYRIANTMPTGEVVWIVGEYLEIERPTKLVFTWRLGSDDGAPELVTVRFEPIDGRTEVVVIHERVRDETSRRGHSDGWAGCLDGLAAAAAA